MSMNTGGRKVFNAKAPDKGSFPLDHYAIVFTMAQDRLNTEFPMAAEKDKTTEALKTNKPSTTTTERITSTKERTTTSRPTIVPPTRPQGCFYEGTVYPLNSDISRFDDGGNRCHGAYCDDSGQVVMWDGRNCGPSTASMTTTPLTPPYYRTERVVKEGTTRRYMSIFRDPITEYHNDPTEETTIDPTTIRITTPPPIRTHYMATIKFHHEIQNPPCTHPPTYPPTTYPPTAIRHGCYHNGKWYRPGSDISRGFDGRNTCYGAYCDQSGQVIMWDDFRCRTTTPPFITRRPRPYTTKYRTTRPFLPTMTRRFARTTWRPVRYTMRYRTVPVTHPPTTYPPTTYPPTAIRHGCYLDGKWYRPGSDISSGFDGRNWCYGQYCDYRGQVLIWDNFHCSTTTPFTTRRPRPYTTKYRTTRRPFLPTMMRRFSTWRPFRSTMRYRTLPFTHPPTTIRYGCYHDGKWHRPGSDISRGFDGRNWCYGAYCDRRGQVIMWDDWRCSTTSQPTTTPPPPTTAPPSKPTRHCYYRGSWHASNSNIFESSNGNGWCYGRRCSDDGQIVLWDNFSCDKNHGVQVATGGCWYGGHLYPYDAELFRKDRSRCYGGVCQLNGAIDGWKRMGCHKEKQFLGGRLRPSWCKYRGELYPRGSIIFSKSLHKKRGFGWCVGAKCGKNGRIIAWGPQWAPGQC
ncbi:hypothetical protein QZH41_006514 [Actinostola sp. cb2023]|nr:hypothetical protein QZH41_006514 [Actinostola sp. cb2023]